MRWILLGLGLIALFVGALVVSHLTASVPEPRPDPTRQYLAENRPPAPLPPPPPPPSPLPGPPLVRTPVAAAPDAAVAPPEAFAEDDPSLEGHDPEPADAGPLYPVSPKGIREVLLSRRAELSECYGKFLAATPNAPRAVMVSVKVMEIPDMDRARIEAVTVDESQTSGHVQMGRCVKQALKDLRFQRPAGSWVTVAFPFKAAPGPR